LGLEVGWQDRQIDNRKYVKRPYCPFRNFCIFLNGEDPAVVLANREYLRGRVDELEFAMDFTNSQVIKLKARVKELEDANSHLEKELVNALKNPFTKYEKKEPSENPKKRGAPFGHEGHFRKKPDKIDKTVDVYLENCPHCGGEDISPCNHTTEHIQEDLEDGKLTVTCFVHCFYWCRNCKRVVHGWGENEIPHAFIGPETRAKASFLRHEIKISYDDAQRALQYLCGLNISAGAIVGFDHKFSEKANPLYEALKYSLTQSPFLHADETRWKRDWLWIFTNPHIAFFHIDESRGSKVVIDHLGSSYGGILITDFWNAYRNKMPAFAKQKCIRHILGDIKDLLDKKDFGEDAKAQGFLEAVKELFKDAVFLHNQHPVLTSNEYRSDRKDIIKRFRKLYQHATLTHHESDNIRKRLITFKNELFVFLKYPETISPTNNWAEIGIRNAVLFRKITFGNMTKNGKKNVSIAMTIIRTSMLKALDPVKILQDITANGVTPELLERFGLPVVAQAP
jgi:hypothetical protein